MIVEKQAACDDQAGIGDWLHPTLRESRMTKQRTFLVLCLCLSWISASPSPAVGEQDPDASSSAREVLARLESRASTMQTLKADFVQEKRLAVLEEPLVLKGSILMQKPDRFSWMVREPIRYSMVIHGELVEQWDEDTQRVERISLSENPVFRVAIQQMRDWLSGAYESMLGEYEVSVLDEEPTSLKFTPRDTALAKGVIESVTVVFDRDERYLRQIHILEKRGDSTLLTLVNTRLNAPIDPSAWKVIQSVR